MPRPSVIAATDFSPQSGQVAGRAVAIAATLGARLILAHVVPGAEDPPEVIAEAPAAEAPAEPALAEAASDAAQPAPGPLGRLGRRLLGRRAPGAAEARARLRAEAQALGRRASARLLGGEPGPALARLAAMEAAELLVLGLHRERRVLDLLRLTTMERIVLASAVPVLIAHRPPDRGYRRVLALTDFSPASARALAMAARIAPGASFHAIHALQLPLGARFSPEDPAADAAITRAELLRSAFLSMPGLPALAEPPEIVPGGVYEVLDFRARELDADLVCIGTHSGRDPDQLGNYARDLMRLPPTDLLVAKPL